MTVDGQRMSKSLGTAIDPVEAADRLGPDPLRLYLVKEIAFGGDGDFSWERYDERYNVDLANNLGNLVSRVTTMAGRYRQGRLTPTGAASDRLARAGDAAAAAYRRAMDALALHEGVAAAFRLVDATNEFIADTSPWKLAKDPGSADRLTQTLFDAAEAIRLAAVLLAPVMPSSSAEILRRVGAPGEIRMDRDSHWRADGERLIVQDGPLGPALNKPSASLRSRRSACGRTERGGARTSPRKRLWSDLGWGPSRDALCRGADSVTNQNPTPGHNHLPRPPPVPCSPAQPDPHQLRRVHEGRAARGEVLGAERKCPKSSKLLKVRWTSDRTAHDRGRSRRRMRAPEALVGKSIVVAFNLKPAKLMGIESNRDDPGGQRRGAIGRSFLIRGGASAWLRVR